MKAGRRKSAQNPIQAAGGIVVRAGRIPLFAIVQRRKDNGWVLPKGKLKPHENAVAAARREAVEETGHNVTVHEYLGAISYETGRRPKIVGFWRMQHADGRVREHAPDIKAVEWLPLNAAVLRLSQPLERAFLAQIGQRAIKGMRQGAERTPRKLAQRKVVKRRKPVNGVGVHMPQPEIVLAPPPKRNLLQRLFGKPAENAPV
jgi:8-oxo-dGTP diphosphatase